MTDINKKLIPKLKLGRIFEIKKSPPRFPREKHLPPKNPMKENLIVDIPRPTEKMLENISPMKLGGKEFRGIEQELFCYINRMRSKPLDIIELLEGKKSFFKDKVYCVSGCAPIQTFEGISGVDDAKSFLLSSKHLNEFEFSCGLSLAAYDLVTELGKGIVGFEAGNKDTVRMRCSKYGRMRKSQHDLVCESTIFTHYSDPQSIALDLLIDDGCKDRVSRLNLFDFRLEKIGIACCSHKTFGYVTNIIYTSSGYETFDDYKTIPQPQTQLPQRIKLHDIERQIISSKVVISKNKLELYKERGIWEEKKKIIYRDAKRYGLKLYSPFGEMILEGLKFDLVFSWKREPSESKLVYVVNNNLIFDPNKTVVDLDTFYHVRFLKPEKGNIGILVDNMYVAKFRVQ